MPDWQQGMAYLLGEQRQQRATEQQTAEQRQAAWQQYYQYARDRLRLGEDDARNYADVQVANQEQYGNTEWTPERRTEFRVGLPVGVQGEGGGISAPTNYTPGGGPPGMDFGGPPALTGTPGAMEVSGMPGSGFSFSDPTPPALGGEFGEPRGGVNPAGLPNLGSLVTGGGSLREEKPGSSRSGAPWWVEPLVGVAGVGANIYGAAQEGKARGEELEQRRKEHEDTLAERRKQREQDRINMILQAISSF